MRTKPLISLVLPLLSVGLLAVACSSGGGGGYDFGDASPDGADEVDPVDLEDGGGAACESACGAGEVCSNGKCTKLPSKCPCPKESFCDLATGSCKAGCLKDEGCNAGRYCDAATRACKPGCNKDEQCGPKKICEKNTCVVGCRTCEPDSNECTSDKCVDGECRHDPIADGTACKNDYNECSKDVCKAGTCKHEPDTAHTICDTAASPAKVCLGLSCSAPSLSCRKTVYASGTPAPSYAYNYASVYSCGCSDATHITSTDNYYKTTTTACATGCIEYAVPSGSITYTYYGCF